MEYNRPSRTVSSDLKYLNSIEESTLLATIVTDGDYQPVSSSRPGLYRQRQKPVTSNLFDYGT
jgi:hypothetical protein